MPPSLYSDHVNADVAFQFGEGKLSVWRSTAAGILMPPRVRCPHSIAMMGTKLDAQLIVRNRRNMYRKPLPPTGAQMRMGLEY